MDFKSNTNQPTQAPQPQAAPASAPRPAGPAPRQSKGPKLVGALIALVVVAVIAAAAFMLLGGKTGSSDSAVEKAKYQAVFMTNGQVYFGKLDGLDSNYTELTDVYYLQVQQSVQPSTGTAQPSTQNQAQTGTNANDPQVSLTKLGNELHGPTDKMHISKDQVLFWENLKDDSTVVKAIKEYQAKQQ